MSNVSSSSLSIFSLSISCPHLSFPPPEIRGELSISWLYDELAKQWAYWLPEDALETLR